MGKTTAEQLAAAQREVEASRQRLRDAHENVVKPLQVYADRNNFASIIAASLAREPRRGGRG